MSTSETPTEEARRVVACAAEKHRVSTAMEVLAIIHTRDRASVPPSLKTLHDVAVNTLISALESKDE